MYSKELVKGTLNAIILNLIEENGRMYGYEIFSQVKEMTEGKVLLKDGSLYPALQKLTKSGVLSISEEMVNGRKRKYYSLTADGTIKSKESLIEIQDFFKTIGRILNPKTA